MNLHLIREEPTILEEEPCPQCDRIRQVFWVLLGISVLFLGGYVLSVLCTAHHTGLAVVATVVIWLKTIDCFVRAHRT